ncbi:MAG: hypothetical protein J0I34_33515 [Pseudonocardia sp.]|uniref:hypothetical protein n=1 Tax=unclassified Pseudonocardia TaxID=2619320 RepID=UPI00086CFAFF|nr:MULTISPECIES: hypothetical protein [unclassified Pseudonocardia]MBN9113680.1 hypothetical protein [Pseudonocardia sp.]ODU99319.1 MAG: hypothetical protein ABT15_32020 [Pseudonocardia sp. SCN 73-27]
MDEKLVVGGTGVPRPQPGPRAVLEQYAEDPDVATILERESQRSQDRDPAALVGMRMEILEAQRAALVAARAEGPSPRAR